MQRNISFAIFFKMNIIAVIALCLIPLIATFVCLSLILKGFKPLYGFLSCLAGAISVIPISLIQFFLGRTEFFTSGTLISLLLQTILLNGIIEELFKTATLFILPAKKIQLTEFCAYSALSALTLACIEGLIYLAGGSHAFELRLITAVLIHVSCGILCGLFVFSLRNKSTKILPLIFAMLFHGIYDYFAMFPMKSPFFYFSIAVILFSVVECRLRYKNVANSFVNADLHESSE